ncbi:MAG: PD40 domain-containing protein [Planctomycetes bacterium]|nr:PD40 domain-containing protein [Planctomycetota bacterium]
MSRPHTKPHALVHLACSALFAPILTLVATTSMTAAQGPVRVSVSSFGVQGNGPSGSPSVSADGRYVAFASTATNLVIGDTNGTSDVFVHDSLLGTTRRVSVDSQGIQIGGGNPSSANSVQLSADGSVVAFTSAGIRIHDLTTGLTTGPVFISTTFSLSANGRHLAAKVGTGLRAHDRVTGMLTDLLVSPQAHEDVDDFVLSETGRYLAYITNPTTSTGPNAQVRVLDRDVDGNGVFDEPGSTTRIVIAVQVPLPPPTCCIGYSFLRMSASGRFIHYQDDYFGDFYRYDRDADANGVLDEPGSSLSP